MHSGTGPAQVGVTGTFTLVASSGSWFPVNEITAHVARRHCVTMGRAEVMEAGRVEIPLLAVARPPSGGIIDVKVCLNDPGATMSKHAARITLLLACLLSLHLLGCGAGEPPAMPDTPDATVQTGDNAGTIDASQIDDYRWILGVGTYSLTPTWYDRRTGKRITGLKIVPHGAFSEGLSPGDDITGKFPECVGYIDIHGKLVVRLPQDLPVEEAFPFTEGRALLYTLVDGELVLGIINTRGGWVVKPKLGEYESLGPCHDGRIAFQKNKLLGFLDRDGKLVIPAVYESVGFEIDASEARFRDGLCVVQQEGEEFFIGTTGKRLALPDGLEVSDQFFEGLAAVRQEVKLFDPPGLLGFVDRSGRAVIEPQFTEVGHFSQGLAPATIGKDVMSMLPGNPERFHSWQFKRRGTPKAWGFIDSTGRFAIPAQFDRVGHFSEGLAQFADAGKIGYIDRTGKVVIPAQFLEAWDFDGGVAEVVIPGGELGIYAYIDRTGRIIIHTGQERGLEM